MAERDDVVFHAVLEDGTVPTQQKMKRGFKQTAKSMATAYNAATEEASRGLIKVGNTAAIAGKKVSHMGGMLGDKASRAMSGFNEKTEKGRQLLTAFGGAIGGAAGQAVYYGGTLSYVIGRFKPWELGIMAVVGAIAALVYAMSGESEAEKKWGERLISLGERIDSTKSKLSGLRAELNLLFGGMTKEQDAIAIATDDVVRAGSAFGKARDEYYALARKYGPRADAVADVIEARDRYFDAKKIMDDANANLEEAKRINAQAIKEKRELDLAERFGTSTISGGAKPGKKGGGGGGKSAFEIGKDYGKEIAAGIIAGFEEEQRVMAEVDKIIADDEANRARDSAKVLQDKYAALARHNLVYLEAVKTFEEMQTEIEKENAERRAQIRIASAEYAAEQEKRASEDRLTYIEASINATQKMGSIIGEVAGAIGASSKRQMQIQAMFQAITDTLNAVHCFAQASEYFAVPFGAGTAQGVAYTAVGTMYMMSATLAAAKAGGAFSGGGGGGGGSGGGGGYSGSGIDRYRGSRGPDRDRWEEGAQATTVWQVNGSVFFGQDAAREITQLQDGYNSRQNPGRDQSSF
uniref:Uncharacterized protein n=1 Tax=viral metagenome TaxID=1070528 RepID=A0A6M3XRL3_9ZZZZ